MTDDPRDILKAAGVECAEVEAFLGMNDVRADHPAAGVMGSVADAAILALARLVAEYKGQIKSATCPECGVSRDEAEEIGYAMRGGAVWECPCGFIYSDHEAVR